MPSARSATSEPQRSLGGYCTMTPSAVPTMFFPKQDLRIPEADGVHDAPMPCSLVQGYYCRGARMSRKEVQPWGAQSACPAYGARQMRAGGQLRMQPGPHCSFFDRVKSCSATLEIPAASSVGVACSGRTDLYICPVLRKAHDTCSLKREPHAQGARRGRFSATPGVGRGLPFGTSQRLKRPVLRDVRMVICSPASTLPPNGWRLTPSWMVFAVGRILATSSITAFTTASTCVFTMVPAWSAPNSRRNAVDRRAARRHLPTDDRGARYSRAPLPRRGLRHPKPSHAARDAQSTETSNMAADRGARGKLLLAIPLPAAPLHACLARVAARAIRQFVFFAFRRTKPCRHSNPAASTW